jgi:hypothetical protein
MTCSFTGQEIPTDKLFVLYYPPSMVHLNWAHSVYAAARAREALKAVTEELQSFRSRYVVGPSFYLHMGIGAVGLGLLAYSGFTWRREPPGGLPSLFVAPSLASS